MREVLDPNFQHYGIDDDGPLPEVQTENFVEIPRSAIEFTIDEYQLLTDNLDPLVDDNDHGITAYQSAKNILITILNDRHAVVIMSWRQDVSLTLFRPAINFIFFTQFLPI